MEPVKPESMYSEEERRLLLRNAELEDALNNANTTRDQFIELYQKTNETLEHNNKTLDLLSRKTLLEIWLTNNNNTMKLLIAVVGSGFIGYVVALVLP